MNIIQIVLGVFAGFMLWGLLWVGGNQVLIRLMPDSFNKDGSTNSVGILILLLVLSIIYSLGSGFLTMAIAQGESLVPVIVLGVLLLLVGIMVQRQYWSVMPLWYHAIFLIMLIPAAILGGWLR